MYLGPETQFKLVAVDRSCVIKCPCQIVSETFNADLLTIKTNLSFDNIIVNFKLH